MSKPVTQVVAFQTQDGTLFDTYEDAAVSAFASALGDALCETDVKSPYQTARSVAEAFRSCKRELMPFVKALP